MYQYSEIRAVHLELSSCCNAECPMCPRNLQGYPYNEGYEEHSMTRAAAETIFPPEFVAQLHKLLINGNFGDMVMNPDSVPIVEYFRQHQSRQLEIEIHTNGGARSPKFWQQLASTGAVVYFALDGLEDTHSLYRRRTRYSTVIRNAQTFIAAGGRAVWKMIDFEHNRHQHSQARDLSVSIGFERFELIHSTRESSAVYNAQGYLESVIGAPESAPLLVGPLLRHRDQGELQAHQVGVQVQPCIQCEVLPQRSVYISSVGRVYPCCYLGFSPETYGRNSYMGAANRQLRPLIRENSALEHSIQHAVQWFPAVSQSWSQPTVAQGRLIHCNTVCGRANASSTT